MALNTYFVSCHFKNFTFLPLILKELNRSNWIKFGKDVGQSLVLYIFVLDKLPQFKITVTQRWQVKNCQNHRLSDPLWKSNVTGRHRGVKQKLRAGYTATSLKQTYYLALASVTDILVFAVECKGCHIFRRGVWYCTLSLCYACIQHSGIILTPRLPLCQISFMSLPPYPWRKIMYSITQSPTHSLTQLIWCPGNWSFCFGICGAIGYMSEWIYQVQPRSQHDTWWGQSASLEI